MKTSNLFRMLILSGVLLSSNFVFAMEKNEKEATGEQSFASLENRVLAALMNANNFIIEFDGKSNCLEIIKELEESFDLLYKKSLWIRSEKKTLECFDMSKIVANKIQELRLLNKDDVEAVFKGWIDRRS